MSAPTDHPARRTFWIAALLIGPIAVVNVVAFLWPMARLALFSFRDALPGGGIGSEFTLGNSRAVLTDWVYI